MARNHLIGTIFFFKLSGSGDGDTLGRQERQLVRSLRGLGRSLGHTAKETDLIVQNGRFVQNSFSFVL